MAAVESIRKKSEARAVLRKGKDVRTVTLVETMNTKKGEKNMAKVIEKAAPRNRERKAGKTTESEPSRNRGLCFLCKIESTCTFPKDPERLGLYCEEFVPYESRPMKIKEDKISSSPSEGRSESEEETSKYKGLCSNCEIRETCQFPKPVWGVWHCGEYR